MTHLGLGVDRLSVSMPVREWERDGSVWDSVTVRGGGRGAGEGSWSWSLAAKSASGAAVFVGVAEVGGQPWGKVEANPSRFADPEGCSLLLLGEVQGAVEEMWCIALGVMQPTCDLGRAKVRRLDLARDFRLRSVPPGWFVDGLARHRRPYARRSGVWRSPRHGNAQTLHAGSGAGMVRLYDQFEAYAHRGAPEGSLRWEVEARRGWLDRVGGVEDVDTLLYSPQRLAALAEERWAWSGMGLEVGARSLVAARARALVASGAFSLAEVRGCVGEMLLAAGGWETSTSRKTAYRYRRVADALGVVVGQETGSGGLSARLDWELGHELVAA